jgi:uncharacterized membrane protein
MKTLLEFLKSTAVGGFFILFPLLLLVLLMEEVLQGVVGLAGPIAELFPKDTFAEDEPVVVAVVLILLVSFLLGLITRLGFARKAGHWLEDLTIGRLPFYQAIKSLTSRFAAMGESGRFKPALILGPDEHREFAYLMEDLGNGFAVVMLPRAPTPMAGKIKLVPVEQVQELNASLGELTTVISHWGVGASELMDKTTLTEPSTPST